MHCFKSVYPWERWSPIYNDDLLVCLLILNYFLSYFLRIHTPEQVIVVQYRAQTSKDGHFSLHYFGARIFKLLRSPGIDSKESFPPSYVVWRAGTITLR